MLLNIHKALFYLIPFTIIYFSCLPFFRGEKALYNMVEICLNPDSEIVGKIFIQLYISVLFGV